MPVSLSSRRFRPSPFTLIVAAVTGVVIVLALGIWWWRSYLALDQSGVEPGTIVSVNTEASPSATASPTTKNRQKVSPSPSLKPLAYRLEVFAEDLEVPWSVVFTSPTRVLVSERDGDVRVIENGKLSPDALIHFDVSSQAEEGLMGLVLDPAYQNNQLLYVCYAYPKGDGIVDKVVRLEDKGNKLELVGTIIDDIPAARFHAGCELSFGPDGKLYISTGDATRKEQAQERTSLGGKILRINSNGTRPLDNPIADSFIYSLGHRNPQGLAWHPLTGQLWSTEHGPTGNDGPGGGDEINAISPGGNYGWPIVSHQRSQRGLIDPQLVFTPAVAPGSAHFYTGSMFPEWQNQLFFAALKGSGLFRVKVSSEAPAKIIEYEKLPNIDVGRVREVTEGPDGAIYITTSNRDGRGRTRDGDDKIYRIVRE